MSKFLIYTDVHFSEFSSIIRSQGIEFSTRLENVVKSVDWAEDLAIKHNCDEVLCLGDFFDKPDLNSRELTALQNIKWANLPHTFLIGNHETSVKSLKFNSVTALKKFNFNIISKPELKVGDNFNMLMLPYIEEDEDRKTLKEYWEEVNSPNDSKMRLVISHNDIAGIQYGMIISQHGFKLDDIEANCRLFLNGHIHEGSTFCKNGINLGNLTGQRLTEDATKYPHGAFILDTIENTLDFIENPYAFNFYKFDIDSEKDFKQLEQIKNNCIISIKCLDTLKDKLDDELVKYKDRITCDKILVQHSLTKGTSENTTKLESIDHLNRFIIFCKDRIGESDILNQELMEVCK